MHEIRRHNDFGVDLTGRWYNLDRAMAALNSQPDLKKAAENFLAQHDKSGSPDTPEIQAMRTALKKAKMI
jgi:hypothetical protein